MLEKVKSLVRSYWDIITYLIFGVLTTVVNYLVYLPLCNIVAWVVAVAFAYLTNKPFVFKSHDWSAKTVLPELSKFVSCRLVSGVMETVIIFLTVDLMHWNGNIWKLFTQILVVIMNYFASKLLVFRK